MSPYFSIIVPVYKVEPYLRECVDSILNQTFTNFELLLVDDGSPDACPAICDEYAARDSRVIVIHKPNSGVVSTRKEGLLQARGQYIFFVDSDDILAEGAFAMLKEYADTNNSPDMLIFGFYKFQGNQKKAYPLYAESGYYDKRRLAQEVYPRMLYDRSKPFYSKLFPGYLWSKVGRRELYQQYYADDSRIMVHEDVCMVYECLYHASSLYICKECLYHYRENDASVTSRYQAGYIQNLKYCGDYLNEHLGAQSPDLRIQANAYVTARTIDAISQEFIYGHPFGQALRHIRNKMNHSGLPKILHLDGLPMHIRGFVLLLKLRLYFAAVLLTKIRLGFAPKRTSIK